MKKIFVTLVAVAALGSASFAQEAAKPAKKETKKEAKKDAKAEAAPASATAAASKGDKPAKATDKKSSTPKTEAKAK